MKNNFSITIENKANNCARWIVIALGFFIPLSTSAAGALVALFIILWLIGGNYKNTYAVIRNNPVALSAAILSALFLLGMLYGELNQDSISHALRFLLVPFLMPFFIKRETRLYAVYGFLAAMMFTLVLSYLAWFSILPPNDILRKASSPYFTSSEFTNDKDIKNLCDAINADIGSMPFMKSENNTLIRLNEILELPELYDRLNSKEEKPLYSQDVSNLVKETSPYRAGNRFSDINERKREKIKQLNRLILEETYPALTPKSLKVHNIDTAVIQNKITHNFLMAFAVFILAIYFRDTGSIKKKILFAVLGGLAIFNVMYIVGGKTGQVVLFIIMIYFLLDWLKMKKGLVASTVIVILFSVIMYVFPSNKLSDSISRSINQFSNWRPEMADYSSVGQRIEFYYNSIMIIMKNPLLGVGAGNFAAAYEKQVMGTPMERTDNPHNEYLFTAVQLGIMGFLALMYLFFSQWRYSGHIRDADEQTIARGLVIAMVVGCLFNSLLKDYTEGLFFFWMSALLFSGLVSSDK